MSNANPFSFTFRPWTVLDGRRVVAPESHWRDAAAATGRVLVDVDPFAPWDGEYYCPRVLEPLSINDRGHVWPAGWPSMSDGDDWGIRDYKTKDILTRLFRLIDSSPATWVIATRHPEQIDGVLSRLGEQVDHYQAESLSKAWYSRIWLLLTASTQAELDAGMPHLVRVPAWVRGLDLVVTGESVDPTRCKILNGRTTINWLTGKGNDLIAGTGIPDTAWMGGGLDWVTLRGEVGPDARPCPVGAVRDVLGQCRQAGVPAWVRGLGENKCEVCGANLVHEEGSWERYCTKDPYVTFDHADPAEWPSEVRVAELPGEGR